MKIREHLERDVTILALEGRITVPDGNIQLKDAIGHALEQGRRKIILNLSGVAYVDSAGIGVLVFAYKQAREQGGTIVLLDPGPSMIALLRNQELDTLFRTFHEENDAIAFLQE